MQKPLALSIAACLGFAGCHVFEKSATWEQTVRARPAETTRDPDPSDAYARKLHTVLADRGVEHQVVVYQYRYTTRLREEAVSTRTAVIYRDESNPRYPWWLKDDRSIKPFWLPNGSLDKQVSYYLRRKAEIIEKKEFPTSGGSGKTSLAFARPAPALRVAAEARPAAPVAKIAPPKKAPAAPVVKTAPAKKAPVPLVVRQAALPKPTAAVTKPAPKVIAAQPVVTPRTAPKTAAFKSPPVTRIAPAPSVAAPKTEAASREPIAARSSTPWSPPAVLDTKEQSVLTAPRDSHLEKRFRAKHGSDYNRFSPADRRKMQQLQQSVASAE